MNKFDMVMTNALHLFPDQLDIWLISVYTELELRGFEGSRTIMLTALRRNEKDENFYLAYFEFEL